jgi:sterol 3beta-glucosyltransferase
MQIVILTVGSRGDVQPYIALGAGLAAHGHEVTIATSAGFAPLVAGRGLRHVPLQADFLELVQTPEGKAALSGGNPLRLMRAIGPMLRRMLDECWEAAQGADLVLYHPKSLAGPHVAEKLGVPALLAHPVPMFTPTGAFAHPVILAGRNLGRALNRLTYRLFDVALDASYLGLVNAWRRERLGLPRADTGLAGRPVATLYGYSRHLLPPPTDWGEHVAVTGFWYLDQSGGWQPPEHLVRFLEAGPPPVYVGFGSMAGKDAPRLTAVVLDALRHAGRRAVVATGAGGLRVDSPPEHVLVLDSVPHDWLFPRVAAVVHHGGAGTTGAALRAGVPQLICPFIADQPFWGRLVSDRGLGPAPIPQRRLTATSLADALVTADRELTRARAAEIGRLVREEDGVGAAVQVVERYLREEAPALG